MTNLITSRRLWLGLGGTGLFLGLFFWRTDLGELGDALAQANYWWVVPAVAIWFVSAAFRSLRWHYLLRRLANLSTRTLYPIVIIGYMANNLLPLRTGEFVRAYVLGERPGVSKMSALGTIAVERVFDAARVVLVHGAPPRERPRRWTERAIGLLPGAVRQRTQGLADSFLDGLQSLPRPSLVVLMLGTSLIA